MRRPLTSPKAETRHSWKGPSPSSRPRVGFVITVLKPVCGHVRVNLRVGQAAVTEQLLDAADVGAAVEQMCREAVPQGMRAGAGIEAGQGQVLLQQPADAARREAAAAGVEKQGWAWTVDG